MRKRITLQLWMASILTIAGIVLIWTAFLIVPRGEIHNSVLLAFGEMSTFAGALFGIDYKHRLDRYIHQPKPPKQEREQEEDEDN
nr:hypothetical protein [uncultured Porphyromonas sp.]DAM44034.1 MAG TPA: hypothetical protein [Caudoviricetes sp.]DAV05762.1 MAG TPA: hypothetical protein [Caudoviricetes sp.]